MNLNDVYLASSGKVFKVVPDLAYIMNRENPRCVGCYFNRKKDQTSPFAIGCSDTLNKEGMFSDGWEYCVGDIIFKEVTDEVLPSGDDFHDRSPEIPVGSEPCPDSE